MAHWEWCREYIDRQAIWRVDANNAPVPGKWGGTYVWQFYLRRATLNAHFAHRLGLLFWDQFIEAFRSQPFQIASCEPSGPPIGGAISGIAARCGIAVRSFTVRRAPKFGVDNWFDGSISRELPVLLVDDLAASTNHLLLASARVQQKLGLPLYRSYFVIVNKVGRGFDKAAQHTENYLDNELCALFSVNNFARTVEAFRERYGTTPKWTGVVK